jgi:hypothetical protein
MSQHHTKRAEKGGLSARGGRNEKLTHFSYGIRISKVRRDLNTMDSVFYNRRDCIFKTIEPYQAKNRAISDPALAFSDQMLVGRIQCISE